MLVVSSLPPSPPPRPNHSFTDRTGPSPPSHCCIIVFLLPSSSSSSLAALLVSSLLLVLDEILSFSSLAFSVPEAWGLVECRRRKEEGVEWTSFA
mmetsp:Transcript_3186/g.9755  ORF Transcript_3186/g.9755 Transcript_3186/m.9755 type:complete len:95 (-) Transcript_3186:993-1277(-)